LDFQNPGTNETVFSPTNLYPGSSPLVSPDGKWLAYMELTPNLQGIHQLWVISADMQQQITFPWKESWAGMIRWEGNSTLLLVDRGGSFLKFDPYTGKKIYITWPLEPPDINPGNVFLSPIMEVSPDGNQIVYLNLVGEYVFVDLQLNAALWKQIADPQVIVNLTSIKWSPDGNQVAIAARGKKGGELYVIDHNGIILNVTSLASAFPSSYVIVGNFEWSPNGKLIALWFNLGSDEGGGESWHLSILDTGTGQLTDHCISSYGFGAHSHFPFSFWSPDGNQLVIQGYVSDDTPENFQVVVDLSQNRAVTLPPGDSLIGWMVAP
jgi:Tol biopolymer transport system component